MDENVVFNNSDGDSSNVGEGASPQAQMPAPGSDLQPEQLNQANINPPEAQQSVPVEPVVSDDGSNQPVSGNPAQIDSGQTGEDTPAGPPPRTGGGLLKKIIIGFIVLILLIFALFLFLPRGESNKNVKLIWWGLWEDQSVMKPLIDDFQKEHPNITVEYIKQDPKQYREKLQTRIKNGNGPDVFRFHNTWTPMLSDLLLPLSTDVITPNEYKKTFYPVMQKDLSLNGAIYGIPLGADTLGLFINTQHFEEAGLSAPETWNDFVRAARRLTVKDENGRIQRAGAAMGTYGNVTHAPDIISLLFIQQGVDMRKFGSDPEKEAVVLKFYTDFARSEENVWDGTLDESIVSFARGSLSMYIGFSWDIFRIQGINKDLQFKTYQIPQLVGSDAALASYWAEGISSESLHKKEALLFIKHLAEKETAQKFFTESSKTRAFGEPYARRDLADSLKENEFLYPFVQQLTRASSSVFASDTNDGEGGINSASNSYLGNTINAIVDDNTSPQTAVETLDQGVKQVFQKYGVR